MYKFLLLFLVILSLSFAGKAQFTKGDVLIGNTFSYRSNSSSTGINQTNHGGNFSVSLGKAINENAAFGINLLYGFTNYDQIPNKTNFYSVGAFYRKYKTLGKGFYIFGEAGAGYDGSKQSAKDNSGVEYTYSTSNGGYISFYAGLDYRISKKFFLEISIPSLFIASFDNTTSTYQNANPQTSKGNQFGVTTGLSSNPLNTVGIGFRLIL